MSKANSFNFNVPGVPQACIERLPKGAVAAYRGAPESAADFCEALRSQLSAYEYGEVSFDNIDVSQVQWDALTFSGFIDVLQEKGIATVRLKAFKCGLDDECIRQVATWLDTLPAESMPSEVHLSNNKFSREGFEALLATLETKRAELSQASLPVWVRVENNSVDAEYLKELKDEGKVVYVDYIRERTPSSAVAAMPSFKPQSQVAAGAARWPGGAQQAPGPRSWSPGGMQAPPGPTWWQSNQWSGEDTRASSNQWGSHSSQPTAWSGSSWSSNGGAGAAGSWESSRWGAAAATPAAQALPAPSSRPNPVIRPMAARLVQPFVPRVVQPPRSQQAQPQQQSQRQTHMATAVHPGSARSRSPPRVKNKPQEPELPFGWSKEWSDEYNIPYFWHADTGESLWESPSA